MTPRPPPTSRGAETRRIDADTEADTDADLDRDREELMPTPDPASPDLSREAGRTAGGIAELLDVMGEKARQATAAATAPASPSQLRLMYLVDRVDPEEGVRMRTVCRQLGAAPPSVSRLCDRLQAIGFLERLPCPDSGREVTLRLTSAGRTYLRRIREERETMLHHAIDAMPPAERRALAIGLAGLHTQLTATTDEHGGLGGDDRDGSGNSGRTSVA